MKIRISINRIIFVFSIIALNEPLDLYLSPFHVFYSVGKWIALLYATFLFVKYFNLINLPIVLILVYYLLLIYPTIIYGGDLRVWFRIFYMFASAIIITHVNMHIDAKYVVNTLFTVVTVILFINLLYLGVYGPDMVDGSFGGSGVKYFIGIRTRIGDWAYIGLMLGLIYSYLEPKKAKYRFIVLMVSILVFSVVNRVTTVLFMYALFMIIKFLADKGIIKLNRVLIYIFYGVLGLNVLIIVFHIQNYFAWLIVDILGEDITLNSRTFIWQSVRELIEKSPIHGYGVGLVAQFKFRQVLTKSLYVSATHNQFLNTLYEMGLVGFALFIAYTRKIIRVFQTYKVNKAYNAIAVGFIIILTSMTVEISGDNVMYFTMLMIMLNFDKLFKENIYETQEE